jgi:HEAT repeat protein
MLYRAVEEPMMHYKRRIRQIVLFLFVCGVQPAAAADADSPNRDPVQELQRWLRIPIDDPRDMAFREEGMTQALARIRTVQDLHRALNLGGWNDNFSDPALARMDQKARDEIVQRLVAELKAALSRPETQLAAANIVAELGTTVRETGGTPDEHRAVMRRLSADLAKLAETGTPDMQTAAARALSRVDPPPEVAAPAFARLLMSDDVNLRRASAAGMKDIIEHGQSLLSGTGSTQRVGQPITTYSALLRLCAGIVPRAAAGLTDSDAAVRRDCADAVRSAAQVLYNYLFAPAPAARGDDSNAAARPIVRDAGVDPEAMVALAQALSDQTPAVIRMMTDGDPHVRLMGRRILEDVADARRRLGAQPGDQRMPPRREPLPLPGGREVRPTSYEPNQDPLAPQSPVGETNKVLRKGLTSALPILAEGVNDSDVEVRRVTVSVLELVGADAMPMAPAIIHAVGDSDRFVRWIAGRTLGRLLPPDERAIAALAGLLRDPDLDVRQVGALALERYGENASAAVPALGQAVRAGDPDARIAALRALQAVGPKAAAAIPSIIVALQSSNNRVQKSAAQTLGRLGPDARSAEPALRQALLDEDSGVRAAAGEALLSVLQPPPGK